MPWEEFKSGSRNGSRDRSAWQISVNSSGVRLSPPEDHPVARAKRVRVFFGTGDDRGWVLIRPSADQGRALNKIKGTRGVYIVFATMPGLAKEYRLSPQAAEVLNQTDGSVRIRLPWIEKVSEIVGVGKVVAPVHDGRFDRLRDEPDNSAPSRVGELVKPVLTVTPLKFETSPKAPEPPKIGKTFDKPKFAPCHDGDQAAIDNYVAEHGVTRGWTLEQAAEYLRTKGHKCTVQVAGNVGHKDRTTWLDAPRVFLDDLLVADEKLLEKVNEYRERAELPAVILYGGLPSLSERGALAQTSRKTPERVA